jgi:hypothetical protein
MSRTGPGDKFDDLYGNWLAAMAADHALERPQDNEASQTRFDECRAAERALLATPAPSAWGVYLKFGIVERLAVESVLDGEDFDGALIFALGALKADLLNLRFLNANSAA